MKVAVIFTGIGVLPDRVNNVSGHSQFPLKTCELLLADGHEVTLVSTSQSDGTALPSYLPSGVNLKIVPDGRIRGEFGKQNQSNGYRLRQLFLQMYETCKIIKTERVDVIHVFGFERMVRFGALLKIFTNVPTVVTLMGQKPNSKFRLLYKKVDRVSFLTNSVAERWAFLGNSSVNHPGVIRDMRSGVKSKRAEDRFRVLFWREASIMGGGDLCVSVFDVIANKYPDLTFDFAVRSNRDEVSGLEELAKKHKNVNIHRFPYEGTLSLEQLIEEALVVVLPYRDLSIEPQMAVLETLSTGCPVITTDIKCLPEMVIDGKNGWLIKPGDESALYQTLHDALSDSLALAGMRPTVLEEFNRKWSWDRYFERLMKVYGSVV